MLEKPKKELHWQIEGIEWFWKRTGTVEYAVCKPDLCHERGRAGCEKKEQFEQAYALSEMFGDLELQNSLKYYIQKNWPSKEKDTLTYNKKEFHDEIGKDVFRLRHGICVFFDNENCEREM